MIAILITVYLVIGCISSLYIILEMQHYEYDDIQRKVLVLLMPAFWLIILAIFWVYEISRDIIKMLKK